MKRFISLIIILCCFMMITACNKDKTNNGSNEIIRTENDSENNSTISTISSTDSSQNNQPQTHKDYVVLSFYAVEGAVIYDQTFDENGYPECCYFHKKCESCGDVSNSNGSARGNLTSSYYCPKCKNTQHVEIKATQDWVEVSD